MAETTENRQLLSNHALVHPGQEPGTASTSVCPHPELPSPTPVHTLLKKAAVIFSRASRQWRRSLTAMSWIWSATWQGWSRLQQKQLGCQQHELFMFKRTGLQTVVVVVVVTEVVTVATVVGVEPRASMFDLQLSDNFDVLCRVLSPSNPKP